MVDPIVAWVTSGFVAPGVHVGSGRGRSLVEQDAAAGEASAVVVESIIDERPTVVSKAAETNIRRAGWRYTGALLEVDGDGLGELAGEFPRRVASVCDRERARRRLLCH
jgi:hypothetical protein